MACSMDRGRWRRGQCVVGGFLTMCISGQLYIIGNLGTYVESYLIERGDYSPEGSWFISLLITCVFVCGQLGTIVGGYLDRTLGSHLTALLGLSFITVGTALTCWTVQVSTVAVLVTFGAISSLGFGCAYGCPYSAINKHKFTNLGLVYGIVNAGFGGGAVVSNFVVSAFINPENLAPDKGHLEKTYFSQASVLDRTPFSFLLLSAMYAVLIPLAVWGMRPPPSSSSETADDAAILDHEESAATSNAEHNQLKGQRKSISRTEKGRFKGEHNSTLSTEKSQLTGLRSSAANGSDLHQTYQTLGSQGMLLETIKTSEEDGGEGGGEGERGGEAEGLAPCQLFRYRTFYVTWIVLFCCGMTNNAVIGQYKVLGQTKIRNDIMLASMGTVGSLLSALSRPMWGFLIDVTSFKTTVMVQSGMTSMLLAFWRLVLVWHHWLYYLFTVLLFTSVSAVAVFLVMASKGYFGEKHLVANMALLWTPITLESCLLPVITSVSLAQYGWDGLLVLLTLVAFVGMLVTMLLPRDMALIS